MAVCMPRILLSLIHRLFAQQFIRFGLVGVAGLAVDAATLTLIIGWVVANPYIARVVSFLVAATTTWALNRTFTFRGAPCDSLIIQWAHFILANAFGGLVNYAVFAGLVATSPLFAAHPVLGVAAGSLTGMLFNFTASKRLVFKDGRRDAATAHANAGTAHADARRLEDPGVPSCAP